MTGNTATPRPWLIAESKILGANGELVARLTALDMPNAELIVASVNAATLRIADLEEALRKANKKFDVLLSCALSATAPDDA